MTLPGFIVLDDIPRYLYKHTGLAFIPFIGSIIILVLFIVIWMGICEQCGKPNWLGVLTVIPLVSFILLGYLAFSKSKKIVKSEEKEIENIDDLPPPPAPIKF